MVLYMDMEAWENCEEMWQSGKSAEKVFVLDPTQKIEEKSGCACGRKVCCGKHRNAKCSCRKKVRER